MKSKHNTKLLTAVFCILVAVMLVPSLIIFTRLTDNHLKSYITQTLDEISAHNATSINDKIDSDLILIDEVAERFSISNESYTKLCERLVLTSGQHGFKRMGIVDKSGAVYSTDGVKLDIYDNPHIQRAFAGETVVSDVLPDDADGKQIFVYTAPIYDDMGTAVIGVLYATCDTQSFKAHLTGKVILT